MAVSSIPSPRESRLPWARVGTDQIPLEFQSYPQKRYADRDRQDASSRPGRGTASGLNSPDISRATGRSLGFGRGEGGGAFGGGGGDGHAKGSNRFGILDGEPTDSPARERRERNPWRDAETGFRDRADWQERHEKAERERENGGMSGGGRYIPAAAAGYASPVIEKAGLGERRGVRGATLRRDTAEAGESIVCNQSQAGYGSWYRVRDVFDNDRQGRLDAYSKPQLDLVGLATQCQKHSFQRYLCV